MSTQDDIFSYIEKERLKKLNTIKYILMAFLVLWAFDEGFILLFLLYPLYSYFKLLESAIKSTNTFKYHFLNTALINLVPYMFFDISEKLNKYLHREQSNKLLTPDIQEAVIGILTRISKVDGRISEEEAFIIQDIINILSNGYSKIKKHDKYEAKKYRDYLLEIHRDAKNNNVHLSHYINLLESFKSDPQKINLFEQFVVISMIDGFDEHKRKILLQCGDALEIDLQQIDQLIDKFMHINKGFDANKGIDPYEVLGCSPEDSFDAIKKKYKKLAKKYHPDFNMHQDLSEEDRKKANEKFIEINNAYEMIKREKTQKDT